MNYQRGMEAVVYVHGKGGSADEAVHYKPLFPHCDVIGFDYHSETPRMPDFAMVE